MSPELTRRRLLALAGVQSASLALAGALRAEGGPAALPFAAATPLRVGEAALRVRDLAGLRKWYVQVLGLQVISQTGSTAVLGAGGRPLLHLIASPDAAFEKPGEAGLYHIAWLMPSRADLARWLVHAAFLGVPLAGFADHLVSEAVYLYDPEGNGIEVYSDRPAGDWRWTAGQVAMATDPLDIEGLLTLTPTDRDRFQGAPSLLMIGHMHLRVGNLAAARAFYGAAAGLDLTRARDNSAAFLSSGGYHHHLGLNTWESAGAGPRDAAATGLAWFSLVARSPDLVKAAARRIEAAGAPLSTLPLGVAATDPWGTELRLLNG